ncbi:MAG: hypothetical protein JWP06_572 [Candidatus Saccharibacteria bacterium]|nr:hypothetical protein [Candidatus Saccharibacteria bacterium]
MQPNPNRPAPDNTFPTPDPVPQQTVTSAQRIIQPLSSEAEIRASVVAPPHQAVPPDGSHSDIPTGIVQQPDEIAAESESYYNGSTLITEPLNHSHLQSNPYQAHSTLQSVLIPTPRKKRRIILPVSLLVVIIGIAGAAFLFQELGHVTVGNLVEEKVQNTTYLRPKQWQVLTLSTSSYGDKLGSGNKSSALVALNVSQTQSPTLATASEFTLELLRAEVLHKLSDESIESAFQSGPGACASKIALQKETDTSSTSTSVGLYKLTATCDRNVNGDKYIMKMRGIAGHDGHLRTIALMAVQSSWDKNHEAYDKIVESLNQTPSIVYNSPQKTL